MKKIRIFDMRDQNTIISSWGNNDGKPVVSILCDTFNHERFIKETLESFLEQETTFPFEIIVHDDASTDNTPVIVQEFADKYPLIIKCILQKENQYTKKVIFWSDFTFPMAQGKYIALCEGDDYWIDKLKLQKQVEFLENNKKYVITWTDFFTRKGIELESSNFKEVLPNPYLIDFDTIFNPYCTMTLTCLFRKDAIDPLDYKKFKYGKDNTLYALVLCHGKGAFMNFQSAVYRWHPGGLYSLRSLFFQRYSSYLNLKEIYDNIPQARTKNIEKVMTSLLKASAFEALKLRKTEEFKNIDEPQKAINEFLEKASLSLKFKYFLKYIKS